MNSKMRDAILDTVAGMRGEKRAANGKAVGRVLSRGLRRLSRTSADVLTGGFGDGRWGWRTLSGSGVRRLSAAQGRLVDELRRLNSQKGYLTDIGRSWSFPQSSGWGHSLSKSQNKLIDEAVAAGPGPKAHWNKLLDREIAALDKRRAARHTALLRVTERLRSEQDWLHEARVNAAKRLAVAGGAGYGLHKLLGGKGDGEKKAAEASEAAFAEGFRKAAETLGVDPGALAKMADGVSDWVNENLPDYTPQERLVQELKAKRGRGIDIEKYRTSNVGNWAGSVGTAAAGTLGTTVLAGLHGDAIYRGDNFLGSANGWIKHLRKFAPTASARHPGVAKALGRLINSGVKGGAYALPILATLGIIGKFNNRRAVNSAIDQVKGTK